MGCDIHGVIEAQVYDGEDYYDGIIDAGVLFSRCYHVFGNLFGVRGTQFDDWPEINVNEGLPEDYARYGISEFLWEGDMGDTHSPHWIALEELEKIPTATYPDDWRIVIRLMQELRRQFDDRKVRLVVWFDN